MRIVIDMQGAQSESRFRGIGRYTLSFAQAVARNRGEHEIILALSGFFPGTIEPIRAAFDGLLPQENIRVWHAPGPVKECEPSNENRREVAELMREAFWSSLQPDVIHICSLFEGYLDDAVTGIGFLDKATPLSVTLHDARELPIIDTSNWQTFCARKQKDLQRALVTLTPETTASQAILAWEALPCRVNTQADYFEQTTGYGRLLEGLVAHAGVFKDNELLAISRCIALNESNGIERQLLLDVSVLLQHDSPTGLLDVVSNYLRWLLQSPPKGYRVEPVYATRDQGYLFARRFTLRFLGQDDGQTIDVPIRWQRGDVLFSLALQQQVELMHASFYQRFRQEGGVVKFLMSDQLPTQDEYSINELDDHLTQNQWLAMIAESDGAVFLSQASSRAFKALLVDNGIACAPTFHIHWVHGDDGTNDSKFPNEKDFEKLSFALIKSYCPQRQLLVDVSSLVQKDHKTGIQRVVRSILSEWLINPPENYRVEPIYASSTHGYRYAREFVKNFIGVEAVVLADEPIEFAPGDVFLGLDLNHQVTIVHRPFLEELRKHGVNMAFIVYDLLPIKFPQFWEPQHSVHRIHAEWLQAVTGLGSAVCISQSVANELEEWIKTNPSSSVRKNKVDWFHLGADVKNSQPTIGLPPDATTTVHRIKDRLSFLMVGTLEPRKGYEQVLDAFEQLWRSGLDANLVLVGKKGWMVDKLIDRLSAHSERNNRLFWLEGISDEYLEELYAASACLIAASYGEGFGLPLIEAAQHKLPIIVRDISVFREVAGVHAFYFQANNPTELAKAIDRWLNAYKKNLHPKSDNMSWLMWKESAADLLKSLSLRTDEDSHQNQVRVI